MHRTQKNAEENEYKRKGVCIANKLNIREKNIPKFNDLDNSERAI
jgi:hypothetical protein